ncbi:MAG: beta-ketoacyl-[acyl-carrier-protein] synthase family protein [Elusimicrobia bacterium]|nr:beta-ketoacyl-[acyl-carrier-protein] synthase family protein [Elusimicrobiota bacterium]
MRSAGTRAVVTGIGLVTPLGADRETSWRAIVGGRSAAGADGARAPLAEGKGLRAVALALRAAEEAWGDAQLKAVDPERLSCVVSSSKPLLGSGADWICEPPEAVPQAVARAIGAEGLVLNIASACATGAQSLLTAAGWIEEGRADVVLAGAAESALHPLYLGGFRNMGVLSNRGVVRPFDRGRDGFLVGEGAAVFVVESRDRARTRGARIYAEILGGDFSSDAHHATRFNSNGLRMAGCLERALARAKLGRRALDYVNAHGTATALNDTLETQALLSLFPDHAPPISSTKGATGHLLGATGAVEIAFSVLALRDQCLPPTLNLEDPETDRLDFVPNRSRPADLRRVASLSFGFGGTLAAVVLGLPA